jgi:glycosyltransferase involved in cell wall biosynthesis
VRPRLVVATSFGVHPATGGGQSRVAGLYGALAGLGVDVDIVSLVGRLERDGWIQPGPGVRELRVPRSPEHEYADWLLHQRVGVPVGDLGLALHHHLTPAYAEAIREAVRGATAVVACHPYPHPVLAEVTGLPLIYEAQDVEADLKQAMYGSTADGPELAAKVREIEAACCLAADHVIVCAARDGERLEALHGLAPDKVVEVPNGADPGRFAFTGLEDRRKLAAELGLDGKLLALFVGSWHEPNLVALRDLIRLAEELDDAGVRVLVCGSACRAFDEQPMPANIDLCGVVDDGFLRSVFSVAAVALNPMRWGSGTNLKMLDYALAGVPLVSSARGARGLEMEPGRHYLAAEPDELPAALAGVASEPFAATDGRVRAAREHVATRFSWSGIAAAWHADPHLRSLLDPVEVPL